MPANPNARPRRIPLHVRWWPKDILDATAIMDECTELAYRRLIDWIYTTGGNLPDDDRRLAEMTKAGRRWKAIKAWLIEQGKIEVKGGLICQVKCEFELEQARKFSSAQSRKANARHGGSKQLSGNDSGYAPADAGGHAGDDAPAHAGEGAPGPAIRKPVSDSSEVLRKTSGPEGPGDPSGEEPHPTTPPSATVIDLKAQIFGAGLRWLIKTTGKSERAAREIVGKWCRDFGDAAVLQVLIDAQKDHRADPVAWIFGALKARANGGGRAGLRPQQRPRRELPQAHDVMAEMRADFEAKFGSTACGEELGS